LVVMPGTTNSLRDRAGHTGYGAGGFAAGLQCFVAGGPKPGYGEAVAGPFEITRADWGIAALAATERRWGQAVGAGFDGNCAAMRFTSRGQDSRGLCGQGRMFLGMLTITDQSGPDHDEYNSSPAHGGNFFIQEKQGGQRRDHETERGEGPKKADVTAGHQDEQAKEKQGFEENSQQDSKVGSTRFNHAKDFGNADSFDFTDLSDALFEQDDPGSFEKQADKKNQKQFGHVTNPGSELIGCRGRQSVPARAG